MIQKANRRSEGGDGDMEKMSGSTDTERETDECKKEMRKVEDRCGDEKKRER